MPSKTKNKKRKSKTKSGASFRNIFKQTAGPNARANRAYVNRVVRHNKSKFNQMNNDLKGIQDENDKKLDSLNNDMEKRNKDFKDSLDNTQGSLKSLKTMIDDNNSELQGKMNTLKKTVDGYGPKLNSLESKINSVEPKINDANKRIKSTEGKVDNVNKRISDTESSMKSKLASAVSSLNKNIDAANEKSKKHGIRRKEEIKTFRKELNDKINKHKDDSQKKIEALTDKLNELRIEVGKLPKTIGDSDKVGIPGPPGPKGEKGDPGKDGKDGKDGSRGKDGAHGKDGSHGKDGKPSVAVPSAPPAHLVPYVDQNGNTISNVTGNKDMQSIVPSSSRELALLPKTVHDPRYPPPSEELRKLYLKLSNEPTPGESSLMDFDKLHKAVDRT